MPTEELQELTQIRAQIFGELARMVQVAQALHAYIETHTEYLKGFEERMNQQLEQSKAFSVLAEAMMKTFGEIGGAMNAQTDRTDKLIAKVESYFGDGSGLEIEN